MGTLPCSPGTFSFTLCTSPKAFVTSQNFGMMAVSGGSPDIKELTYCYHCPGISLPVHQTLLWKSASNKVTTINNVNKSNQILHEFTSNKACNVKLAMSSCAMN